ncbi:LysR substrate-binding domain-containing protein [Corynebacterium alimapuense]|uniref:LysR family transcriptional regulator n=1 Tax=Corynebacterium alimapuense TaxID=1576874 RepID=A0A3M8KAY1_9CORY|nr:LysR substrate-binding domain-containing protein [Corynebacterium alimapuense]RNE50019.1 LysR family transcriptional regulator [Corynebacterium alimapuense]
MSDISATDLQGFIAVAESGHLTDTAAILGIPQPTLTRRIRRVESSMKANLFDRGSRRMVLNSRGRAFLPHARAMLAELAEGSSKIARLMDPERGTIRLDFMHSLGTWMVPDILRDYRSLYPAVDIRLHQGAARELVDRIRVDATDVALVGPRPPEAGEELGWHQLRLQRLALALPEDHPLAREGATPVDIRQVKDENFVGMLPGYGTRLLLDRISAGFGFSPRLVFESMELTTVAGLVSAGLGVALLPLDDPYLAPTGIVLRPLDPPEHRELGLVWRADAESAPPIDQFREFVIGGV